MFFSASFVFYTYKTYWNETYKVIPDVSQMQAQLSQILESELVPDCPVPVEQLDKAVLADPESVENAKAATANLALSCEFVIHAL